MDDAFKDIEPVFYIETEDKSDPTDTGSYNVKH